MRGIAGKDHPAMDEFVHPPALEFVQRYPFEIELVMTQHPGNPRPDVFRLLFGCGIRKPAELQVDPPDIVRLLVQQRRSSGVERRVEPEPATARKSPRHSSLA